MVTSLKILLSADFLGYANISYGCVFEGDSDRGGAGDVARRKTIHALEKQRNSRKQVGTLDVAFERKFKEILNCESS